MIIERMDNDKEKLTNALIAKDVCESYNNAEYEEAYKIIALARSESAKEEIRRIKNNLWGKLSVEEINNSCEYE